MTGILFHGPEIFDSGWARRIISAIKEQGPVRSVLAGTMGRTAVIDSGLEGIEFSGQMPGKCLKELAMDVDAVVLANFAKSAYSGQVFGAMVTARAGVSIPVVQAECAGPFFVEWTKGCDPQIIFALEKMGMAQKEPISIDPSIWEDKGLIYRRMNTAAAGDFIFLDGIMVGRSKGKKVVIVAKGRNIVEIKGAEVKQHGIEKLDRFGGVDLRTVKLASTPSIRRSRPALARTRKNSGRGVAFVDHAGMYVHDLVSDVEGVVTVGDDTTAVVGDIMYRFGVPVIGIVDGDEDLVLKNGQFAQRSVRLTVPKDDEFGLEVLSSVFGGKKEISTDFDRVRDLIVDFAGENLLKRRDF